MFDEDSPPLARAAQRLETAVADLFTVHDTTLGIPEQPAAIRFRGELRIAAHRAYEQISLRIRELDYTPMLRHDPESGMDVLLMVPGVRPQAIQSRLWVNALLFVLTILSTLFVGASWSDLVPPDADLAWVLTHLWVGWPFALSLMVILTGHELGHYFAGRHYKVPVSLPYFIPFPLPPLGTMGAFIQMKGQVSNRRQMLTVGAAGPLVGFVLAVPILILGLYLSEVQPMAPPEPGSMVFLEGNSILYLLLKLAVFGQVLPGSGAVTNLSMAVQEMASALLGTFSLNSGYDVFIHPVALAGWAGLLVTALNLLPVGQLDGGHVVYSLVGERAKRLTWPVIGFLLLMGVLFWQGWLLWAGLVFVFGQSHPAPLDEVTRLDTSRKLVAVAVLLVLILTFSLLPMQVITGDLPAPDPDQTLSCLALPGLVIGTALWLSRRLASRQESASHRSTDHG
ncbi:site-2 protease family protein [Chloroflexota bacterium]